MNKVGALFGFVWKGEKWYQRSEGYKGCVGMKLGCEVAVSLMEEGFLEQEHKFEKTDFFTGSLWRIWRKGGHVGGFD